MILFGDYHTHTKYSGHGHGKGTILENASVAADKGLKQIAITDHGFNHKIYGVKRGDIAQVKEDILNAKEVTGVDILLGEYKSMKRAYLILEEILGRFSEDSWFGPPMTYRMPKE